MWFCFLHSFLSYTLVTACWKCYECNEFIWQSKFNANSFSPSLFLSLSPYFFLSLQPVSLATIIFHLIRIWITISSSGWHGLENRVLSMSWWREIFSTRNSDPSSILPPSSLSITSHLGQEWIIRSRNDSRIWRMEQGLFPLNPFHPLTSGSQIAIWTVRFRLLYLQVITVSGQLRHMTKIYDYSDIWQLRHNRHGLHKQN